MQPVTADILLNQLPPYKDEWITIHPEQSVKDIIREVLEAHEEFQPYYESIALYFDADTIEEICAGLYDFMRTNIRYKEEPEESQTTALPTGLLVRGYGDCKHYSGFSGGVLDALGRLTGKKIDWAYRFASYDPVKKTPHHVFTVVRDNDEEIWIDPTPGAQNTVPFWQLDKKVNSSKMLARNLAGIGRTGNNDATILLNAIGAKGIVLSPVINGDNNINFQGTGNKYAGIFNQYLGLSAYQDFDGDKSINKDQIAQLINQQISKGPSPNHTVDGDFIQWVYDSRIRSWNFYYPGGVVPGFNANEILPANYPRPFFTADNKLQFQPMVPLDDMTAEIHILTAWLQDIVNNEAEQPWPVKPREVKEFSQGRKGDNFLFQTRRKADNWLSDIGKALEDAINFVKDGVISVVGFIPRNAFLGLVGINAFNFAGNFWDKIQSGEWDKIANTWKKLGGNPEKLRNTIEDGKDKKAILGQVDEYGETIGVEPATSTAALLAAAAPIIAAMLAFIDKDGKVTEVLQATKGFLSTAYPDLDLTAFGFLDKKTGKYIEFEGDPRYDENKGAVNPGTMPGDNSIMTFIKNNPVPVALGAGVITYFFTNRKGRKPNYLVPAAVAVAAYFVIDLMLKDQPTAGPGNMSIEQKRAAIKSKVNNEDFTRMVDEDFTDQEAADVYELFFGTVSNGSALQQRLLAISDKYQIFI